MSDFEDMPGDTAFKGYESYLANRAVDSSENPMDIYDFENAPRVSSFKSYSSSVPEKTVNLLRCLLTDKYREDIERLRNAGSDGERKRLKSLLPCVTISGIFDTRCESGLIRHSGFIGIDIDGKDQSEPQDWEAMKKLIGETFDCVYYVGLSAGGDGIFAVCCIRNPKYLKMHYRALAKEISEATGLKVDMSCSDIARLRGASYDPLHYYNANPTPYNRVLMSAPKNTKRVITSSKERNRRNVEAAIELICAHNIDITRKYKKGWLRSAVALYDEFGEEGRKYFHLASSRYPGYNEDDCDRMYDKAETWGTEIKLETFFYQCKIHGIINSKGGMVYDPSIITEK